MNDKITVLIADDHAIVREGLRLLLETDPDIQVVAEAENGRVAVQETIRVQPDVVLLDIEMPLLNGVEAAARIREEAPATRVLILTTYDGDQIVRKCHRAGAAGYILKETVGSQLFEAIRAVHTGHPFYCSNISKRLLNRARSLCLEEFSLVRP